MARVQPPSVEQQIAQLHEQGWRLREQGRGQEALERAARARDLARQHLGKAHPSIVTSLVLMSSVYSSKGDYPNALRLQRESLELDRALLGKDNPALIKSLIVTAALYHEMGDDGAVRPLVDEAMGIIKRREHEPTEEIATGLDQLAGLFALSGQEEGALALRYRALQVRKAVLGDDHPVVSRGRYELGSACLCRGDSRSAESLLREELEVRRRTVGESHRDYAKAANNLAMALFSVRDFAAALPLLRRALEIARESFGESPEDCIHALHQLASAYEGAADYSAALPLGLQALDLGRKIWGEDDEKLVPILGNLATLYQEMGDHASALPLAIRAVEISRKSRDGNRHGNLLRLTTTLNNLGLLYFDMGNYGAALQHLRRSLEITGSIQGTDHLDYATVVNNIALIFERLGEYVEAETFHRKALEIRRTALGEDHPEVAQSLNNVAQQLRMRGDYAAAEPLYRQSLEIERQALGPDHPDHAGGLINLAALCICTGRYTDALQLMIQAAAIDDRMIGQILSIASERQRTAYLNTITYNYFGFLSLVRLHLRDCPEAVAAALDLVLRRKAIAAEALATQRDAMLGGKHPALEPKVRELAALRLQIARKTLAGPGPDGLDSHLRGLAEWGAQKEGLEVELARQIPEMNLERKLRAADRRAVALNLPEGVALVEFVRFPVGDVQAVPARGEPFWKPAEYVAFVLPAGAPDDVRVIDLGEAEPIDRKITDFRAAIIGEAETKDGRNMAKRREEVPPAVESDVGLALRAALFDRLAPALGNQTRLLIAPDGDLTRLPFEVLPTADGRRLIDDFRISYLSCGRDVLRFGPEATGQSGEPLVVADPDFDLETVSLPEPAQPKAGFWSRLLGRGRKAIEPPGPSVPTRETAVPSSSRHSRDLDRDRSAYHFHRLPGTRVEGERVAARLGASPWLDAAALEGRLKTACRSPRILHLATHGFFLSDQERDPNREGRGLGFEFGGFSGAPDGPGRLSGPMMENPMLRSGLALAGANTWLKAGNPPDEAEDGLLTAEDVTGLDLLATELVVLSACETGLGQVHVGEGVFGLRRAFVLAGAKTLVMSLWKVPDEPTRELMEDFYSRLLAGEGRAEALRQAQLAMKAKYPDPFYWGAFICQGDPGPLPVPSESP
jgi:CHAT domain-containing protein/tetratricopeptide (TPR) repeat protein